MSKTNPNDPVGVCQDPPYSLGLTKREYFIAHAPVEKWDWFKPIMSKEPKRPKLADERGYSPDNVEIARGWYLDPCFELSDGHPELQQFEQDWMEYRKAKSDWDKEYHRQSDIQWPSFWADEQIKFLNL